ncbi:DNA ligase [Anaeromassilibacillus sp. An172]|uniref:DNA ligase n=1 Tax=Anaeromassilibacillus sp. An172 TaxID=1965570 RepID=UPI000B37E447|nr:DNA ligase [Anaeromassilibacillus sp. An172]OUP77750.1 DNA ligase [Anaeromassilibacillus sp. An172]
MSNMSQLAAELDELRHCGEILIGISDTLREMFSGSEETQEAQETPAEKTKGKAKAAAKAAPAKEPDKPAELEKQLTLADVRAVLAEKSRAGFTEEVKALIAKHGADRLSEVPETEYAALLADAEVLG